MAALQVWGTINIKQVELYPGIAHSSWPLRPLHSWVGLKPRQTCGSPSPTTTPPERDNRPQSVAKLRHGWWLRTAVRWTYLEEPDPVVTGPGVLGTDCVVAVNSALREVAAAHVSELHTLLHGPWSRNGSFFCTCRKRKKKCIFWKKKKNLGLWDKLSKRRANKTEAELCDYLFSARWYPDSIPGERTSRM